MIFLKVGLFVSEALDDKRRLAAVDGTELNPWGGDMALRVKSLKGGN